MQQECYKTRGTPGGVVESKNKNAIKLKYVLTKVNEFVIILEHLNRRYFWLGCRKAKSAEFVRTIMPLVFR